MTGSVYALIRTCSEGPNIIVLARMISHDLLSDRTALQLGRTTSPSIRQAIVISARWFEALRFGYITMNDPVFLLNSDRLELFKHFMS